MNESLKEGTVLHGKSYHYKIIRTLGQGTFGITYLASVKMTGELGSLDSGLLVAVKEFFMRDFNGRDGSSVTYSSKDGAFGYYKSKFIHEAENLSHLHNTGIIKVMELFEENQTAYYVMEYVSEGSLDEHIMAKGRLTSSECIGYAMQIANALGYMHKNRMLHLDLKPNNIMIRRNGDVVLIDFGLSKRFDAYGKPETSTTIGHGTPGYAPVEQANYRGDNSCEFPATMDIYAFGATMFKMLTGHRPPEASLVLNEGFPFTELQEANVPKEVIDLISKCMEPLRKNRYKTTEEISNALNAIERGTLFDEDNKAAQGYFKKKYGEREYGTFHIKNVPVTSAIDFPEYVNIKLWDNSYAGKSYEVIMTDGHFDDGYYGLMRIWDKGVLIDEHEFEPGIPDDVKGFIVAHGFLSTEHWENECGSSPIADDFGTDTSITMISPTQERFVRRVEHAHPDYHNLLLDELLELLNTTSLAKELNPDNSKRVHTEPFVVPYDTFEVTVFFTPCQIGCFRRGRRDDGFGYTINEDNNIGLSKESFKSILKDIENLGINVGLLKKDTHDYSEAPGELIIEFKSKGKGTTRLSLLAFNTDMLAGNIYGVNINVLAESIERIFLNHLPKRFERTRELIYSIPDLTSEIWIEYSKGGIVGLDARVIKMGIVNDRKRIHNEGCIYNPEELSVLINGLRQLELRSQEEIEEEPATGEVFPKLSLSLYDSSGHLLKTIYAQDNGGKMIGNVIISVEKFKEELAKMSKSFRDRLPIVEKGPGHQSRETISGVVFRFVLFSIVIGLLALPTYLFAKPDDKLFSWLWITIGITELFTGFLFNIGGRFNKTSDLSNFETISFLTGIVALIAYVVLWIIQMCFWWA